MDNILLHHFYNQFEELIKIQHWLVKIGIKHSGDTWVIKTAEQERNDIILTCLCLKVQRSSSHMLLKVEQNQN